MTDPICMLLLFIQNRVNVKVTLLIFLLNRVFSQAEVVVLSNVSELIKNTLERSKILHSSIVVLQNSVRIFLMAIRSLSVFSQSEVDTILNRRMNFIKRLSIIYLYI